MALSKKQIIEAKVEELMAIIIANTDYEVVEVEYLQERGQTYLRVFVDKPDGFGLEDCQLVSERLGEVLEEGNYIDSAYNLEVSSPGIDRQLKKDRDFIKYAGKDVELHLFAAEDGKKIFVGALKGLIEGNIVIQYEDEEKTFARQKVSSVKLHVEF